MCDCRRDDEPGRRRFRPIRFLFHLMFLYVLLVFGGGTLIQTGQPIAVEIGRIFHIVTFVDPTIHWAQTHDQPALAIGLRVLSNGVDVGQILS